MKPLPLLYRQHGLTFYRVESLEHLQYVLYATSSTHGHASYELHKICTHKKDVYIQGHLVFRKGQRYLAWWKSPANLERAQELVAR